MYSSNTVYAKLIPQSFIAMVGYDADRIGLVEKGYCCSEMADVTCRCVDYPKRKIQLGSGDAADRMAGLSQFSFYVVRHIADFLLHPNAVYRE
jgi:hypothetical protein